VVRRKEGGEKNQRTNKAKRKAGNRCNPHQQRLLRQCCHSGGAEAKVGCGSEKTGECKKKVLNSTGILRRTALRGGEKMQEYAQAPKEKRGKLGTKGCERFQPAPGERGKK